jgi:hypothetical protein
VTVIQTDRGFQVLTHPTYPPKKDDPGARVIQQSSVIGDYPDAFDRPGSSALWIGDHHHLNREEVGQLVRHLQAWLDTGSLEVL